jgi:hypothetical protein
MWEATAKTSGTFQLGRQSRDLTLGGSEDSSVWQASVNWSPRNNSTIQFTSGKTSEASIGIGNSRDLAVTGISWMLDWNSQWRSSLSYSFEDTDFVGTNITMDSESLGLNIDYLINERLTVNISYQDTTRDSNDVNNQLAYDQTMYGINLNLSMF